MDKDDHVAPLIDTSVPRRMPEFVLGAALLVTFVSLTVLQVFTRYVLNDPLPWTEELAAHLLIWMVFIGAVGVHRNDTHLRLEILDEWASPKIVASVRLVYDLIILVVLLLLVKSGWDLYQSMRFDKLPALRWPMRNVILIAPVASAIMALYSGWHIVGRVRALTGRLKRG